MSRPGVTEPAPQLSVADRPQHWNRYDVGTINPGVTTPDFEASGRCFYYDVGFPGAATELQFSFDQGANFMTCRRGHFMRLGKFTKVRVRNVLGAPVTNVSFVVSWNPGFRVWQALQ